MPLERASASATDWFPLCVALGVLALTLGVCLIAVLRSRRRLARRLLRELEPLVPGVTDPVAAARRAAAEATRHDAALTELRAIVEAAPFGIVALDGMGRVLALNPAAARMLGAPPERLTGRLLIEAVRAPRLQAMLHEAERSGAPAEAELTFAIAGQTRTTRAVAAPLLRAATRAACVVVLEDVTELRRLETVRTEFVANVSHELRTPVTNVRGYAETLLESFTLEEQARDFVEVIQRNATRLGRIIDDLLLLATLESAAERAPEHAPGNVTDDAREDAPKTAPLDMEPVEVRAVLMEGIESHEELARRKGVRVECMCEDSLRVQGNAGLLRHAVSNLVENAVKYSPEGGTVHVRSTVLEGQVLIEVQDRGPGIPAQHLARLFERFYRVDRARSRASGGTGLGLAIVKHVAQVHGGTVDVESRTSAAGSAQGPGSCFRLRLPSVPDPRTI